MRRTLVPALSFLLSGAGCSNFLDYFSPVVSQGLVLGVDDPVVGVDLGAEFVASTFLARAESLAEIEENLYDDAERVEVVSGSTTAELLSQGQGLYLVDSDSVGALQYTEGATYTLRVVDEGKTRTVGMAAPGAPTLSGLPVPPATHPAGAALSVDLTGQGYDNSLAAVVDEQGNLVWDNRPEGVGEYLDWIGSGGEVGVVQIPGEAFPNPGTAYVLGIAGIVKAPDAAFDNFNPLLSNFAIGTMAVAPIVTAP